MRNLAAKQRKISDSSKTQETIMTKKNKGTLIRAVLVLLLLIAVYIALVIYQDRSRERQETETAREKAGKVVLSLKPEEIRSIRYETEKQAGDLQEVYLLQEKGQWVSPDDPSFRMKPSRAEKLTKDLAELSSERTLTGIKDLDPYGLGEKARVITISDTAGQEYKLYTGLRSDSSGELYFQTEKDSDVVYLTKTRLDQDFSADLKSLYDYEEIPAIEPSRIRRIEVEKEEDPYVLVTPGDDSCTVEGKDGTRESASLGLVGMVQNQLSNLSWLSNLEYDCQKPSLYGLDQPAGRLTVFCEGEDAPALDLLIGAADENGNYYVQPEGSKEVHSIRKSYLETLMEAAPQTFWSLSYSFTSIGDLNTLTVAYDGEEHVLRRVSEDGLQDDAHQTWLVDGKETDKESFTKFYYEAVSATAQERLPKVPEFTEEPVLELRFSLTDGSEKTISYYEGDQNFCTVIYDDGQKAASTNRLYVDRMRESLEALLETVSVNDKSN